jgi:3-deoxy-7-phosphoheptulonate synthase
MAGQFAKPRSSPTEKVDGKEVISFKGDNVNGFSADEREPDPNRFVFEAFRSLKWFFAAYYVRTLY